MDRHPVGGDRRGERGHGQAAICQSSILSMRRHTELVLTQDYFAAVHRIDDHLRNAGILAAKKAKYNV
jgi:hypothetical protein